MACALREIARDACCIQVVAVVGPAQRSWFGVLDVPSASQAVTTVARERQLALTDVTATIRPVVDAVQFFG